ncbi:MAG: HD domain-containing protein [Proteobacteria bacterium]|nr:HD domain-containing protein [Pseudomonadota bacterium]
MEPPVTLVCKKPVDVVHNIMKVIEDLNHLKDVDTILDRILYEARQMTSADAGSIFLVEDQTLKFSYVHNDTLFQKGSVNKQVYASFGVPINEKSIVGYSALKGQTLVLDDAYELDADLPYSFNRSFDKESGYRTRSILTIPLVTLKGDIVGVMQLINAKNDDGEVQPFCEQDVQHAPLFASHASVAIERGIMTRELILRMMKMAEMRDPSETGAHVMRVGSYTAEIYHHMMQKSGMEEMELKRQKDIIRLAAMLHDVGKVGIADAILKKPGKLDEEEFATMMWHTVYGAALFANSTSELDDLCRDIALHHHQKWNGKGYPGDIGDDYKDIKELNTKPVSGEDISLPARICALADVYDALCSKRSYKDAWPEEKVDAILKEDAGTHFDPAVVEAFFEIKDTILAIREKWSSH